MSQVSKQFISEKMASKIDTLFKEAIISCNTTEITSEFLDDILTPTEKIMMAKRLTIAYLLIKEYPYDSIKKILKVSSPTIWNISLALKYRGKGYRKIIKSLRQKQAWSKLFQEIADAAIEIIGMGKGANWKATKSFLYQRKAARANPLS